MRTIFINGKFTAQRTTGVQRSAACIVEALDGLLGAEPAVRWVLLCPPGAVLPKLRHVECRPIGRANASLHFWEQILLPFAARGAMLVNLAGSAPLMKRRQVCTFHDAAVFDFPQAHTAAFLAWYRFLMRRVGRTASLLLTVSEFSRGRLVKWVGIASNRVAVMPGSGGHMLPLEANGGTLERLGLRAGAYFVAVGSANPVKNFQALLAAFAGLPERFGGHLVIIGGTNDKVFAQAGRSDLVENVRIVRAGTVSDTELKALYQSALALVFPSLYEGFGLPPLEAMACGCPVAASNAASIPEVCGDAALYFDPHAPDAIGAAMMRLHDEPELRGQLRERGARRVQHFSWNAAARVLMERLDQSAPALR